MYLNPCLGSRPSFYQQTAKKKLVFSAVFNFFPSFLKRNYSLENPNTFSVIFDNFEQMTKDSKVNFIIKFELACLKRLKMHTYINPG